MSGVARRTPPPSASPQTPSSGPSSSPIINTPGDNSSETYTDSEGDDLETELNVYGEDAVPLQKFSKKHGYRLDAQPSPAGPRVRWSNDGGTPLPEYIRAAAREREALSEFFWSRETERRIVRRTDIYLVGFMAVLYTLGFLDRSSKFIHPKFGRKLTRARYWKCKIGRARKGPSTITGAVGMGIDSLLPLIHLIRMVHPSLASF